jgi:hypothetical protein
MKACWAFFIVVILYSCSEVKLKPSEYIDWVNNKENGLILEKTIGEIKYELQYQPADYIIASRGNETIDYDTLKSELQHNQNYCLRISNAKGNTNVMHNVVANQNEYLSLDYFLSYEFQNNIHLISAEDTIRCGNYHFVNTRGMTPYVEMLFSFPMEENKKERTIYIFDNAFGSGPVQFTFSSNTVSNIPTLIF